MGAAGAAGEEIEASRLDRRPFGVAAHGLHLKRQRNVGPKLLFTNIGVVARISDRRPSWAHAKLEIARPAQLPGTRNACTSEEHCTRNATRRSVGTTPLATALSMIPLLAAPLDARLRSAVPGVSTPSPCADAKDLKPKRAQLSLPQCFLQIAHVRTVRPDTSDRPSPSQPDTIPMWGRMLRDDSPELFTIRSDLRTDTAAAETTSLRGAESGTGSRARYDGHGRGARYSPQHCRTLPRSFTNPSPLVRNRLGVAGTIVLTLVPGRV